MDDILGRIATLNRVGIIRYDVGEQSIYHYEEHEEHNPITHSPKLRELLITGAKNQDVPYIYQDEYMVYFACIRQESSFYFVGPMSLKVLERIELHHYYQHYGMSQAAEKRLQHFVYADMLDIIEIIAGILMKRTFTDDELIYANHLVTGSLEEEKHEKILYDMKEGEEELYHHTYQEERKLLDCVREGRVEDALRFSRNMDADLGKLSTKEVNHWKNVAIVAITLCTRAAIDGGISPAVAYRISDFYIQKSDSRTEIAEVIKCRDHAVEELTRQVERKKSRRSSSYVERCKDYVDKNYRGKIYLAEIAESLGLSESYLSRLFKRETGVRLQDYIVDVRLEHAANLLKYSEESISKIAEYVNFPSQSYMGKMFQKKYQISPKRYREENRLAEYFESKKD